MGSLPTPPPAPAPYTNLVIAAFCDRYPNPNLSNWLECFNPTTNSWSRLGVFPDLMENQVLKGFAMVSLQGFVFIIGGRLYERKVRDNGYESDPDEFTETEIAVLSTVWRYSVSTGEWSSCASLDMPRFDFACTVSENKIYVAGGKNEFSSSQGLLSAELYDPVRDEWTGLPDMGTARYKCVGVTWQGKVHVVGGFADVFNIYSPARSSAEVLDTARGKWVQVGMWQLDVPPNQIVPVNGRLFSSGDCLNAWKGHIEAYDGMLNIWNAVNGSHLQMLSSPRSTTSCMEHRLYLTMAPIGAHLYFLAGYRMQGEVVRSMSVVHRFDTSAIGDPWRSFEPMEEEGDKELCSHCCVVQV